MEKHFNFGHTIKPTITIEQSSQEGLDHLFQIGEARIKMETPSEQSEEHISIDSDQTPQLKENKKEKKVKKEKHKKHHKDKNEKKEKKQHKKQKGKNKKIIDIDSQDLIDEKSMVPFQHKDKGSSLLAIYQRQIEAKNTSGQLQLSQKIGQGLLEIDRIEFPQKQLYHHGLMDKQIPQYRRLPFFQHIIGGKHKKQKQIVQHISKKINQNQTHPYPDEISRHRYHQFQGYNDSQPQPLPYQRSSDNTLSRIRLGQAETFTQSCAEQKLMRVTKEYNSRLNQNPKDIALWLEFINIQPSIWNLPSGSRNNTAVIERQLSIIEKALQLNPMHEQLGLLKLSKLQQKHRDTAQLIGICKQLIQAHPHVGKLWRSYLYLQLNQFTIFSHEYCRKIFEDTTKNLKMVTDNCRSAMQLWIIRKAGLQLLKQEVNLFKLQGYGQLATGILMALIDFNFFMPDEVTRLTNHEEKVRLFGQYWQDPHTYRLGDLDLSHGWNNPTVSNHNFFIGDCPKKIKAIYSNIFQQEQALTEAAWRPSHPIHDKLIIEERPESYVLIEDINFALQLYTDTQSLVTLIDLLAEHLELPLVFGFQGIYSQFSLKTIESCLTALIKGEKKLPPSSEVYWWQRYWDPQHSSEVLKESRWLKLQYFRRILKKLRGKIPQSNQNINQYLTFISCCYLQSQDLRSRLGLSEQEVLSQLEPLLSNSQLDVGSWCIYIETTFIMKQNLEQCINCYLQLLDSARSLTPTKISEVIFWLWTFVQKNCPHKAKAVLKLYLHFLDNSEGAAAELKEQLSKQEELRLERYLKEHFKIYQKQCDSGKTGIQQLFLHFLLLDAFQLSFFSQLQKIKPQIMAILISFLTKQTPPSLLKHFIASSLIQRRLLNLEVVKNILPCLPSIDLIKYWSSLNNKPMVSFLANIELWQQKNLPLWMALSICLWEETEYKEVFQQYFFKLGKSLCFSNTIDEFYPEFIILFNKLMLFDNSRQLGDFAQYSLKQLPYCKQLYLTNLQQPIPHSQVLSLLKEKNIRLLHPSLVS